MVMKSTKVESQEGKWVVALSEMILVAFHIRYWPLCNNQLCLSFRCWNAVVPRLEMQTGAIAYVFNQEERTSSASWTEGSLLHNVLSGCPGLMMGTGRAARLFRELIALERVMFLVHLVTQSLLRSCSSNACMVRGSQLRSEHSRHSPDTSLESLTAEGGAMTISWPH